MIAYTHIGNKRRPGNVPLVRGEQKNIGTRRVHLVTLTRVNRFLLHGLDLERLEFLIKDLTLWDDAH